MAEGEAETDGAALPLGAAEPDADGLPDGDPDGDADPVGTGTEGKGIGVGSGMKRDGTPAMARMTTSTKIAMTVRIHGRAKRSSRIGRAPR